MKIFILKLYYFFILLIFQKVCSDIVDNPSTEINLKPYQTITVGQLNNKEYKDYYININNKFLIENQTKSLIIVSELLYDLDKLESKLSNAYLYIGYKDYKKINNLSIEELNNYSKWFSTDNNIDIILINFNDFILNNNLESNESIIYIRVMCFSNTCNSKLILNIEDINEIKTNSNDTSITKKSLNNSSSISLYKLSYKLFNKNDAKLFISLNARDSNVEYTSIIVRSSTHNNNVEINDLKKQKMFYFKPAWFKQLVAYIYNSDFNISCDYYIVVFFKSVGSINLETKTASTLFVFDRKNSFTSIATIDNNNEDTINYCYISKSTAEHDTTDKLLGKTSFVVKSYLTSGKGSIMISGLSEEETKDLEAGTIKPFTDPNYNFDYNYKFNDGTILASYVIDRKLYELGSLLICFKSDNKYNKDNFHNSIDTNSFQSIYKTFIDDIKDSSNNLNENILFNNNQQTVYLSSNKQTVYYINDHDYSKDYIEISYSSDVSKFDIKGYIIDSRYLEGYYDIYSKLNISGYEATNNKSKKTLVYDLRRFDFCVKNKQCIPYVLLQCLTKDNSLCKINLEANYGNIKTELHSHHHIKKLSSNLKEDLYYIYIDNKDLKLDDPKYVNRITIYLNSFYGNVDLEVKYYKKYIDENSIFEKEWYSQNSMYHSDIIVIDENDLSSSKLDGYYYIKVLGMSFASYELIYFTNIKDAISSSNSDNGKNYPSNLNETYDETFSILDCGIPIQLDIDKVSKYNDVFPFVFKYGTNNEIYFPNDNENYVLTRFLINNINMYEDIYFLIYDSKNNYDEDFKSISYCDQSSKSLATITTNNDYIYFKKYQNIKNLIVVACNLHKSNLLKFNEDFKIYLTANTYIQDDNNKIHNLEHYKLIEGQPLYLNLSQLITYETFFLDYYPSQDYNYRNVININTYNIEKELFVYVIRKLEDNKEIIIKSVRCLNHCIIYDFENDCQNDNLYCTYLIKIESSHIFTDIEGENLNYKNDILNNYNNTNDANLKYSIIYSKISIHNPNENNINLDLKYLTKIEIPNGYMYNINYLVKSKDINLLKILLNSESGYIINIDGVSVNNIELTKEMDYFINVFNNQKHISILRNEYSNTIDKYNLVKLKNISFNKINRELDFNSTNCVSFHLIGNYLKEQNKDVIFNKISKYSNIKGQIYKYSNVYYQFYSQKDVIIVFYELTNNLKIKYGNKELIPINKHLGFKIYDINYSDISYFKKLNLEGEFATYNFIIINKAYEGEFPVDYRLIKENEYNLCISSINISCRYRYDISQLNSELISKINFAASTILYSNKLYNVSIKELINANYYFPDKHEIDNKVTNSFSVDNNYSSNFIVPYNSNYNIKKSINLLNNASYILISYTCKEMFCIFLTKFEEIKKKTINILPSNVVYNNNHELNIDKLPYYFTSFNSKNIINYQPGIYHKTTFGFKSKNGKGKVQFTKKSLFYTDNLRFLDNILNESKNYSYDFDSNKITKFNFGSMLENEYIEAIIYNEYSESSLQNNFLLYTFFIKTENNTQEYNKFIYNIEEENITNNKNITNNYNSTISINNTVVNNTENDNYYSIYSNSKSSYNLLNNQEINLIIFIDENKTIRFNSCNSTINYFIYRKLKTSYDYSLLEHNYFNEYMTYKLDKNYNYLIKLSNFCGLNDCLSKLEIELSTYKDMSNDNLKLDNYNIYPILNKSKYQDDINTISIYFQKVSANSTVYSMYLYTKEQYENYIFSNNEKLNVCFSWNNYPIYKDSNVIEGEYDDIDKLLHKTNNKNLLHKAVENNDNMNKNKTRNLDRKLNLNSKITIPIDFNMNNKLDKYNILLVASLNNKDIIYNPSSIFNITINEDVKESNKVEIIRKLIIIIIYNIIQF